MDRRIVAAGQCLALMAILASPCAGQPRPAAELDLERFRPTPDREGFIGIPGTRTPGPGMWNAALWLAYSSRPLTLRSTSDGRTIPVVEHRVNADVLAQVGLGGRVALLVDVPVIVWQDARGSALDGGPDLAAVAFRDPLWAARLRILGEEASGEHRRHDGPGLAIQVAGRVPLGLEHELAGEGAPQLEASLLGDFHFLDFGIGVLAGYRYRFARPVLQGVLFEQEILLGAALQLPTILIPNVSSIVEVRAETAIDGRIFRAASTPAEIDLGFRWAEPEGDLSVDLAVGVGFGGGVGAPGVRAIAGLSWAPRRHDADRDGIEDAREPAECRLLPEDPDGFEDDDGCPDPDNDGDLVPDADDRCPDEAAPFDQDADEDGCVDPLRDRDHDGFPDREDGCPRRAEDRDGFQDDDGCPEPGPVPSSAPAAARPDDPPPGAASDQPAGEEPQRVVPAESGDPDTPPEATPEATEPPPPDPEEDEGGAEEPASDPDASGLRRPLRGGHALGIDLPIRGHSVYGWGRRACTVASTLLSGYLG
ncbi:MAG: hypothetical protein ACFCGT_26680 [Sandaracinaceae bacterium]